MATEVVQDAQSGYQTAEFDAEGAQVENDGEGRTLRNVSLTYAQRYMMDQVVSPLRNHGRSAMGAWTDADADRHQFRLSMTVLANILF